MSKIGDALIPRITLERVDHPERERFLTVRLNGAGVVERTIKDGKTPVAFTGYRVRAGQFVYSRIDARNGAFGVIPDDLDGAVVSKDFPVFDINGEVADADYLMHFFRSGRLQHAIQANSRGATNRQRIKEEEFLRFPIPMPRLEEQRRIAGILDQAKTIRDRHAAAVGDLDALRDSVFEQRFVGAAHEGRRLSEIAEVWDCAHTTPKWTESGVTCLRTSNLGRGVWNWGDHRFVDRDQYEHRSKGGRAVGGDIIVSREGTVGVAAIVPEGMELCMGQRLVQVRGQGDVVVPIYLLEVLLWSLDPIRIGQIMVGSTSKHLNVKDLRALSVPLPRLDEQRTFAAQVEEINAQRDRVAAALEKDEELFASLQARAFSGRL